MPLITRTIREQVTNQIRDEVVAGKLPPGQPLREGELAERAFQFEFGERDEVY